MGSPKPYLSLLIINNAKNVNKIYVKPFPHTSHILLNKIQTENDIMGIRMMWCSGCVASSLDAAIEGCEISSHHRGMFIICINAISSFAWRPSSSLGRSMNKVARLPTFWNNHRELRGEHSTKTGGPARIHIASNETFYIIVSLIYSRETFNCDSNIVRNKMHRWIISSPPPPLGIYR